MPQSDLVKMEMEIQSHGSWTPFPRIEEGGAVVYGGPASVPASVPGSVC